MNANEESARLLRINELAKKAKSGSLTNEEVIERDFLRKEYLAAFRANMEAQVEQIVFVEKDGTHTPVHKKSSNS